MSGAQPLVVEHPNPDLAWLGKLREDILDPALPIIDPHHHLWDRLSMMRGERPQARHGFETVIERVPRYLLDELHAVAAAASAAARRTAGTARPRLVSRPAVLAGNHAGTMRDPPIASKY